MIDVTGTDAHVGDIAEIFGEHLPIAEIANKLGTISYEVLTSISHRVQRVYINE
jgi:alanine racemase